MGKPLKKNPVSQVGTAQKTRKPRKPNRPHLGAGINWKPAYLKALVESAGHRMNAARAVPIDYTSVWRERRDNQEFAKSEAEVVSMSTEMLEDEAQRRAYSGVKSFTYGKEGEIRSERTEYSDTLLLRILERRDPTWRPKSNVDVTTGGQSFDTRADRKAALIQAREDAKRPLA